MLITYLKDIKHSAHQYVSMRRDGDVAALTRRSLYRLYKWVTQIHNVFMFICAGLLGLYHGLFSLSLR